MTSIFLSHNHQDKAFVRRLGKDLQENGIQVWIDEAEIKVGDSLLQKIEIGIDQMEYLGVVLSKYSINSEWVKRETRIALTGEIASRQVRVLPILLDDCNIPGFLRDKLYADFREEINYAKGLEDLLVAITQRESRGIEFRSKIFKSHNKDAALPGGVIAFPVFHYEQTNNYLVVRIKNLDANSGAHDLRININTDIEFDGKKESQSEAKKVLFLEDKQEVALACRELFIDFDSFVANIGNKSFESSYLSMSEGMKSKAYDTLKKLGYLNWRQPSIGNLIIELTYKQIKHGDKVFTDKKTYPLNIWKYDHGIFIGLSHEDSSATWPA